MNFSDLVRNDLKCALEAAEAKNFKTAYNMINEAKLDLEMVPVENRGRLPIEIARMTDTIKDLENSKSWLESYYACGVGASAINDVKNGRAKTINLEK